MTYGSPRVVLTRMSILEAEPAKEQADCMQCASESYESGFDNERTDVQEERAHSTIDLPTMDPEGLLKLVEPGVPTASSTVDDTNEQESESVRDAPESYESGFDNERTDAQEEHAHSTIDLPTMDPEGLHKLVESGVLVASSTVDDTNEQESESVRDAPESYESGFDNERTDAQEEHAHSTIDLPTMDPEGLHKLVESGVLVASSTVDDTNEQESESARDPPESCRSGLESEHTDETTLGSIELPHSDFGESEQIATSREVLVPERSGDNNIRLRKQESQCIQGAPEYCGSGLQNEHTDAQDEERVHSTIEIPTINLKELELHAEPGVVATLSSLINNNIEEKEFGTSYVILNMNPLQNFNDEELNLSGENDEALVDYVRCNDLGVIFQDQAPSPVNLPEADETDDSTNEVSDYDANKDNDDEADNDSDFQVESADSDADSEEFSDTNDERPRKSLESDLDMSGSAGGLDDACLFALPRGTSKSKLNFCFYCKKLQSVISRHLETVHKDEVEVRKFAILPKGNIERRKIIETIRLNGNHLHNKMAAYNQNAELIVPRRPREKRSGTCYRTCHNCKGVFSAKTVRRHRQRCLGESSKSSRSNTILARRIAGRLHPKAGDQLKNVVFCVMREDEIVRGIRYDELLIIFANMMCLKYRKQQQHDLIRARLRLLGRLLRTIKSLNSEITDFASIYQPKFYDDLLRAIDIEARFNKSTGEHEVPSVVTTSGIYLKVVGETFIVECIKNGDEEKKRLAENFLTVHKASYSARLNKNAIEAQIRKNRIQQKELPTTADIRKLQDFLAERSNSVYEELRVKYSYEKWRELSSLTLVRMFVFNRRRTGEMDRIHVEDLNSRQQISEKNNPEEYNSLSNQEKERVQKYTRLTICGKLGRTVAVLLCPETEASINLILKYRSAAKVHDKNPFIFGMPGYDHGRFRHLQAYKLIGGYAKECGAEHPDRLRGTQLRKHMATLCASENVDENQIHDIATFMGHEDEIHRRHYRRTVISRDVCGVSKVLERASGFDRKLPGSDPDNSSCSNATHEATEGSDDSSVEGDCSPKPSETVVRKGKKREMLTENADSFEDFIPDKKRKIRWSEKEKEAAWKTFRTSIQQLKLPSAKSIREFLKKNPCVQRTESQIRTWASNQMKSRKK